MRMRYTRLLLSLAMAFAPLATFAQHTVVKTNALYWATATPNMELETQIARQWTAGVSLGWNPFTLADNKKLKHIAVQPEVRRWLCSPFAGHFVAAHAVYSHFNAGGVKAPFGLFPSLGDYRFQGNLYAVGIGYGYSWMLPGNRWSIEAEVGIGAGYASYGKYECATCGSKVADESKMLVMPTKAALSIVYNIK